MAPGDSQSSSNKDVGGFKLFQPWAAHSARQLSKRARETMMSRSAFQAVPLRHGFLAHPSALAGTAFSHSPLATAHLHGPAFMTGMLSSLKSGGLQGEGMQTMTSRLCRGDVDGTTVKGGSKYICMKEILTPPSPPQWDKYQGMFYTANSHSLHIFVVVGVHPKLAALPIPFQTPGSEGGIPILPCSSRAAAHLHGNFPSFGIPSRTPSNLSAIEDTATNILIHALKSTKAVEPFRYLLQTRRHLVT